MAIRQTGPLLAGCLVVAVLLGSVGCNHHASPSPYGQTPYGNPWATPNAAGVPPTTTLPPPPGQQAPVPAVPNAPPYQAAPPGTMPPTTPYSGVQGPNWNNPGTLTQQQQRATVFDPFANNELGPEIVGGRPREFQKPMTEATRAHGYRDTRIPF